MKQATPKQVRHHYARIFKLAGQYSQAMYDAKHAGVLVWEGEDQSPTALLWETRQRFDKAAEKQLAQAMREEIKGGK